MISYGPQEIPVSVKYESKLQLV